LPHAESDVLNELDVFFLLMLFPKFDNLVVLCSVLTDCASGQ